LSRSRRAEHSGFKIVWHVAVDSATDNRSITGETRMSIRRIEPNKRLSAAVVHDGTVYISGQVPDTPHADVSTQTREILAKIDRLLREAGSDKSHLLNASVWLADIITFDEMNKA